MFNLTDFSEEFSIGFVGAGNMAYAIASGLVSKGLVEGKKLIVSATSERNFDKWKKMNSKTCLSSIEVISKARIIFLCVKPNNLQSVSDDINKELSEYERVAGFHCYNKTIISILAGVDLETLEHHLKVLKNVSKRNIMRAMPNTSLQIGEGCTAITTAEPLENMEIIKSIFAALGQVEVIPEEKFDAITGLSGSGPAYCYTIIGLRLSFEFSTDFYFFISKNRRVIRCGR